MTTSDETPKDDVCREAIFRTVVEEAGRFYKLLLTVASSFLGGTILFLERIAPSPSCASLLILSIGWLALVACIGCIAFIQRLNLESGRQVLDGNIDKAKQIDGRTRLLSSTATILLTVGMLFVVIFGVVNANSGKENHDGRQGSPQKTATQPTTKSS